VGNALGGGDCRYISLQIDQCICGQTSGMLLSLHSGDPLYLQGFLLRNLILGKAPEFDRMNLPCMPRLLMYTTCCGNVVTQQECSHAWLDSVLSPQHYSIGSATLRPAGESPRS
jgi:hypothetical protein